MIESTLSTSIGEFESSRSPSSIEHDEFSIVDDSSPHILVVDDDTRIRELIKEYLMRNNCKVTVAADADAASRKLAGIDYDLIILDVMLPGKDGIEFANELRSQKHEGPILMLSARSTADCRICGLEAGADDYMSKPFEPRELLLRIENWVRRGEKVDPTAVEQLVFGNYTFVLSTRELKENGETVRLTEREREILYCLTKIPGEPISRDDLSTKHSNANERTIDVQVNHLRRKIEVDPSNPRYLQTVRGKGYQLVLG